MTEKENVMQCNAKWKNENVIFICFSLKLCLEETVKFGTLPDSR